MWFSSLLLLPYPSNTVILQFLDICLFDIYIIISNQLFAAKHSSVLFLMDFLFFFLKLILDLFLHLLYFLCGYCSAMLINVWIPLPEKKKPWFVLFAFVCIAFDFSFPITSVKSLNKLWEKDVHCWFSCTTELLLTFSYLLMVHTGISKLSFPLLLLYF